jgi:enterochelin esterase-like enzyme
MPVSPGPNLPSDVTDRTLTIGVFESPLIWQLLLLAAVIGGYLMFRPRGGSRQSTRRFSFVSKLIIICTLCAMSGAFWLNDYIGYVRTPHDLADLMQRGDGWLPDAGRGLAAISGNEDGYVTNARTQLHQSRNGAPAAPEQVDTSLRVEQVGFPDPARGVPTGTANVMLPPGYNDPANKNRRYPVVYLIHGYPAGNSDDWFTSGDALGTMQSLLADQLVQPMIVVAPDMTAEQPATDWECLNMPNGPKLEDYLVDTVVPNVDAKFRTVADRRHRALGGMSGGAYCALNIGLQHLPTFASLLISLPYDDLGDSVGILAGHPDLVAKNTPRTYLPTMTFPQPIATMITTGTSAPTDVVTAKRLAGALSAHGQQVALRLQPGMTHTWRAARAALPYLFAYANEVFGPANGSGPVAPPATPVLPPALASPPPVVAQPPVNAVPTKPTKPVRPVPHRQVAR